MRMTCNDIEDQHQLKTWVLDSWLINYLDLHHHSSNKQGMSNKKKTIKKNTLLGLLDPDEFVKLNISYRC